MQQLISTKGAEHESVSTERGSWQARAQQHKK